MILRRITQHVRDQNWTAIAIDFVIVVVGVFIGIQVSNWNAAQSERHDYSMALERYAAEIDANLADLQDLEARSLNRRAIVFAALDTLLTCEDSPDNRRTVEAGVRLIIGTYGVGIRTTSLHELTESPPMLAQQSAAERKLLNDTRVRIDFLLDAGADLESLPLATPVQDSPISAWASGRSTSLRSTRGTPRTSRLSTHLSWPSRWTWRARTTRWSRLSTPGSIGRASSPTSHAAFRRPSKRAGRG